MRQIQHLQVREVVRLEDVGLDLLQFIFVKLQFFQLMKYTEVRVKRLELVLRQPQNFEVTHVVQAKRPGPDFRLVKSTLDKRKTQQLYNPQI